MPGFQTNAGENITVDIGGHRFNWLAVKQQKSNYCNQFELVELST